MFSQAFGGIGLFLIGMVLATEGLRAAAGEALRRLLLRFTGGPAKAMLTGAVTTALVQSSSATTLATIGFVGAGLLTFTQALGVILGANVGTTTTGWIVALVGLRFDVSAVALPLIGVGALMRLFGGGRRADLGLALAGFGILFVGIDTMQAGMGALADRFTPELGAEDTALGRVGMVLGGIALTAVMQSSSAAVATVLTALHSGNIGLSQAAAVVIGANIGTTVTAGIAAIGATTSARRVALAHLLFNAGTGLLALLGLPILLAVVRGVGGRLGPGDATVMVATFHTAFNLLGVAVVLPVLGPFARLVERAVPDRGPRLSRRLDARVAGMGDIAIEAIRQTLFEITAHVCRSLSQMLARGGAGADEERAFGEAADALSAVRAFLAEADAVSQPAEHAHARHVSTLHALDHLERLVSMLQRSGQALVGGGSEQTEHVASLRALSDRVVEWTSTPMAPEVAAEAEALSLRLADARKSLRARALEETARRVLSPTDAEAQLEAMRRLDEGTYYLWRLCTHLQGERLLATES